MVRLRQPPGRLRLQGVEVTSPFERQTVELPPKWDADHLPPPINEPLPGRGPRKPTALTFSDSEEEDTWQRPLGADVTYDAVDIFEKMLPRLHEDSHFLIMLAGVLGWEIVITGKNAVTIRTKDRQHKHHFGISRVSSGRGRKIIDDLRAYGDSNMINLEDVIRDSTYLARVFKARRDITISLETDYMDLPVLHCGKPTGHAPHRWESWTPYPFPESLDPFSDEAYQGIVWCSGKKHDCLTYSHTPEARMETHIAPEPDTTPQLTDRHVVSERPWMAHQSSGSGTSHAKAYPTRSTIERLWSDGTKDYRCAYDGCEVVKDRPKQIVTHFAAKHVRFGNLEKQGRPTELVDDPNFEGTGLTRKVRPRKSRIDALARHLEGLDLSALNAEELAEETLTFLAELSNSGSSLSQEREPLTPEQIITRIRTLVDPGTYVEQQEVLEERDLQIALLEEELENERLKYATLEGNLQALKDLVGTLIPADSIGKG